MSTYLIKPTRALSGHAEPIPTGVKSEGTLSNDLPASEPFTWGRDARTNADDRDMPGGHADPQNKSRNLRKSRADVPDQFIPQITLSDIDARRRQLKIDLGRCRVADLKKRYPLEWNCYRGMRGRERTNGAIIAKEFGTFAGFLRALGPSPARGYTVDRTDCFDPEYAPGKVSWASKKAQANNRSTTVMVPGKDGVIRPVTMQAAMTGQKSDTIRKRLKRGWTEAEAMAGQRAVKAVREIAVAHLAYNDVEGVCALGWPLITKGYEKHWEKAWRAWCGQKGHEGLDRAAFFCWLINNRQRDRFESLERRFPDEIGDNVNPYEAPGPEVTEDAAYRRWDRAGRILDHTRRRLDAYQQWRLTGLIDSHRHTSNFEEVYKVIADRKAIDWERRWD